MKIIQYDSQKGRLKVNFKFEGLVAVSYMFNYFEANSNDLVITPPPVGNNLNNDDDNYPLPMPSILNKGRIIFLNTMVNALDRDADYNIIIEVFQKPQPESTATEILLDTCEFKGSIKKGGLTQNPMLIAKLDCE